MNAHRKAAVAAFSLANLLFLRVWYELVHLQHDPLHQYFLARAAGVQDYLMAIVDVSILALLLFILLRTTLLRTAEAPAALGTVITALLLLRVIYLVTGLSDTVPEILWWEIQDEAGVIWDSPLTLPALLVVSLSLLLVPALRRLLARAAPAMVTVLVVLLPFGALMIARAALLAVHVHDTTVARTAATISTVPAGADAKATANTPGVTAGKPRRKPGSPRVVVAVFDEMDYRLAFVEPPPGLKLPALARLRASSLFATNAFPPSNATAISMPAMLTGRHLQHVQVDGWSNLNLYFEDGRIVPFHEADTLFHRAWRGGFRSGVIGWYHPYCRLFPHLADCLSTTAYGYATSYPAGSLLEIAAGQLRQIVPFDEPFAALRYVNSMQRLDAMLADASLDLVFAHLSIPHVPYIYDAERLELTDADRMAPVTKDSVNYFANLRLVDNAVDHVLDVLHRNCTDCVLVLTSDHWWRWSRRYDGHTDRRVPFMVHAIRDGKPLVFERRFNNEVLAPLVMQLLEGRLATHADIARWIARNGRPRNPAVAPWMKDEDRMATSQTPPPASRSE